MGNRYMKIIAKSSLQITSGSTVLTRLKIQLLNRSSFIIISILKYRGSSRSWETTRINNLLFLFCNNMNEHLYTIHKLDSAGNLLAQIFEFTYSQGVNSSLFRHLQKDMIFQMYIRKSNSYRLKFERKKRHEIEFIKLFSTIIENK